MDYVSWLALVDIKVTSRPKQALSCLSKKHKVCSSRQSDVQSPDLGVKSLYLHSPKIIPSISYKNL